MTTDLPTTGRTTGTGTLAFLATSDAEALIARCPSVARLLPDMASALERQTATAPGLLFDLAPLSDDEKLLLNEILGEGEVAATVDAFWQEWQNGDLDKAYALFGAEYRARTPLLSFLQQAQAVIAKIGAPASWKIVQSRELAPAVLGLGVDIQGSTATLQTIMVFRKIGETWVLMDSQFRLAPAGAAPAAPSVLPRSRPDLRPDLRPALEPAAPPPAPAEPPPAPAAPAAPAQPDAPVGPDGQ